VRFGLCAALALGCGSEQQVIGECEGDLRINELATDVLFDDTPGIDTGMYAGNEECESKNADWVELFNRGEEEESLCDYALSHDSNPYTWHFCDAAQVVVDCEGAPMPIPDQPPDIPIRASGFLVLVLDGRATWGRRHVPFDLPDRGGWLALWHREGSALELCQKVEYPDLHPNESWGAPSDGDTDAGWRPYKPLDARPPTRGESNR
jgi:hypothetical protein